MKHSSSLELMPKPFDWIDISAGQVTLGGNDSANGGYVTEATTFDVVAFSIAKYPITNAQYAKFIEADGYKERRWWTEAGWKACEEGWHYDGDWKPSGKAWSQPRHWTDATLNGAEQPVVGVSWYESVAFCLWLSNTTGEKIMLPTEDQWQYAAQGDDGRDYPWGEKWDASRCNNNVDHKGIGQTIPVAHYEGKGDSPFGVVDMAGNVWEWCLTDYENETNDRNSKAKFRVLRGSSWRDNYTHNFRCNIRLRSNPDVRANCFGFRISRFK